MRCHRHQPFLILAVLAALAGSLCFGETVDLKVWKHAPVLESGRVMPMDSLARQTLLSFSGRSRCEGQPAVDWFTRVLFMPEATRDHEVFLVNNPEVAEALGLPAEGRKRYSYRQLEPTLVELTRLARAVMGLEPEERSPVDRELVQLLHNLTKYRQMTEAFRFAVPRPELGITSPELRADLGFPDAPAGVSEWHLRSAAPKLNELRRQARGTPDRERTVYQREVAYLYDLLRALPHRHQVSALPAMIPALDSHTQDWLSPAEVAEMRRSAESFRAPMESLVRAASAYHAGRQVDFDLAARQFISHVSKATGEGGATRHLRTEVRFNDADPFYRSEMLYGFSFLLALFAMMFPRRWLYMGALALTLLGLIPHTYGIIARMIIMGRPPVTNLYATFLFVGWVSVLLGLAAEFFQRNRLGLVAAAFSGLAFLMTAARFATEGDTMGVMVAVLDSNFWLATHVVTISIGYAGCVVSGLLGHIYLLQALRRDPDHPVLQESYRAVYGAQAFGLIFSFLGTMLGGVWADQSWGRFWGWDPKENGALVIVLWSAMIFHARTAGLLGPRGFAAASVLGVVAVLAAWLGVNLLSVGLHSYGFTSGLAAGFYAACLFEVVFVAATAPFARKRGCAQAGG